LTDSPTPTIAVAENAFGDDNLARAVEGGTAVLTPGPVGTPDEVAALTAGADAILVTLQPLRQEHIAALSDSVRIIARAGVGLDTIDVEAARARGIRVVYQPNYATNEVADHAASLALASWRRISSANDLVRSQGWATSQQIGPVHALQDATLGVLGSGRIGRALIERLRPFVSRVVAFDAYPDPTLAGVEWAASTNDLLDQADLLSLHLPLNDETRHVIDAAAIERMPDGAVLINVSRGGLVDEGALATALESGKLSAAGLDVFEHEPLGAESSLRSAPNLLVTPHVAWYSIESGARMTAWSIADAISFLKSGEVRNGALA
jgi:D-3-phosphoglycerate dehydrogenase